MKNIFDFKALNIFFGYIDSKLMFICRFSDLPYII